MNTGLLVTSAGSGTGGNLMRSLRAGTAALTIVGCHDDQFILKNSTADRNYLVPPLGHSTWIRAARRVVEAEQIALLIPRTHVDAGQVARARAALGARVCLPRATGVALCGDNYRRTQRLRARGVPAPATHAVTDLRGLDRIWERLGRPARAWCRVRAGAGSRGAIAVGSPAQARSWITYWRDMRGVPVTVFTLSEFLPRRDFGGPTLSRGGAALLGEAYERRP